MNRDRRADRLIAVQQSIQALDVEVSRVESENLSTPAAVMDALDVVGEQMVVPYIQPGSSRHYKLDHFQRNMVAEASQDAPDPLVKRLDPEILWPALAMAATTYPQPGWLQRVYFDLVPTDGYSDIFGPGYVAVMNKIRKKCLAMWIVAAKRAVTSEDLPGVVLSMLRNPPQGRTPEGQYAQEDSQN